MDCPICTEKFNVSNHKPILCPVHSCAKTACRTCYQTFLCGDHITVPQCIFCNTHFTHSQVQHVGLTKLFLQGDFAKHQQNVLFAQEQAMLPAAQAAVAHDRLVSNLDAQIKDVSAQIKQLMAFKLDLLQTKRQLQHQGGTTETTLDQFIHRCADPACNGFVSSAWKCATCEKHTCSHCRELKAARDDPLHICNPDTVASVALLKSSTKPCPNCKVPVHKTDGCDQMFCTQCNRLWSWNTGKFETRGHNPHYLQWMRENHPNGMPRDPNDVLCGREIDPRFLSTLHRLIRATIASLPRDYDIHVFGAIFASFSSITHLRHHDLHQFQLQQHDRFHVNLHARKAFVSNIMSLHKFKLMTRRNHLLLLKNDNILQILQAVIQATTDIAFRFQHHLSLLPHAQTIALTLPLFDAQIQSFALELFNLKQYANHELLAIHNDFHSPPSKRFFISPHNFKLQTFPYHISFQEFIQLTPLPSHPL